MKNRRINRSFIRPEFPDSRFFVLLLVLAPIVFFSACYEKVEGCLDPNASNFSLDADRECGDCCTYPKLSVGFVHYWTDEDTSFTFNYNSLAFKDGGGNPFSIGRITFYLKDFALVTEDGRTLFTTDSVLVQRINTSGAYEPVFIRDDYLLVNPSLSSSQDVGTLIRNGTFTQFRFVMGVDDETDRIDPLSLTSNHPLSLLDTSMYSLTNGRYLSNRLEMNRDTAAGASPLEVSYGAEIPVIPITIDIPGGFERPAGFNLQITIGINYAEWFRGVQQIDTASEAEIRSGIVAGLPNAFSLVGIAVNIR